MSSRRFQAALGGGCLLLAVSVGGCTSASARTEISGAELFEACISCHGPDGQGNPTIGAPRIAGLPLWYVSDQLQRFQTDIRGAHPDDAEGLRMRAMSRQMMTEAETAAVATYVASLPHTVNPATRTGTDPAAGQATYAVCMTCHGANGEGSEAVKAPPIGGMDDWYLERQLQKFQTGVRGSAEGDALGPIMKAMAATVPPDAVENVAAYIHTLPGHP